MLEQPVMPAQPFQSCVQDLAEEATVCSWLLLFRAGVFIESKPIWFVLFVDELHLVLMYMKIWCIVTPSDSQVIAKMSRF